MESNVESTLKFALSDLAVTLEDPELEYMVSVISDTLSMKRKIKESVSSVSECTNEIVDIIGPILSEQVDCLTSSNISRIAVDLCGLVFPNARTLMTGQAESSSNTKEIPLLDFPDLSLAYMGLELLRHTSLRLYRGKVYGIVGRNGVGKTTLLHKLAKGEIPGFPSTVNSAIVGHELVGKDLLTPRQIIQDSSVLASLGFVGQNEHLAAVPCSDLSGGWRMRVSIGITISAKNIDLLLLDEPTNHLDKECVEWLITFLKTLTTQVVVIVSHDEKFLDSTINFLIYFHVMRLETIESNFTEFVKSEGLDPSTMHPIARGATAVTVLPFHLPRPGILDGVKSSSQTIAKLENVFFSYGQTGRGVEDISGRITLSSRIALIGNNGAGKSTIAGLLVGQLTETAGTIYRHPNLRIAHVSQHHVHHLEKFFDKTCLDYFVDRFGAGVDKEVMSMESVTESSYEQLDRVAKAKKFAQKCNKRSVPGGVEALVGRRKEAKEYAYEVKWVSQPADKTDWFPRSVLETELGIGKLCSAFDQIVAQKKSGTDNRSLDFATIKNYLKEFGILPHTAEGKIAGLSGGQKSRLTLAAAMWVHPHLLILDEPTNYLDVASLTALLDAISGFQGGVVIISHNAGFVDKFANEKWIIDAGKRLDRLYRY